MKSFTKTTLIFSLVFITIGLIAIVIALTLGVKFDDAKRYETIDFTHTYTDVSSLDVQVDVGEVVIKEGTEFKIEATGVIKNRFESEVINGTWLVKEKRNRIFIDFFFEMGRSIRFVDYSPKIVIYIPENYVFDKLNIDIGAGKGTVEKMNSKVLNVDVGTGELIINDLISEKSNIDCGVGSISINGKMTGYNKIDCGVGKIKLYLVGKETDYNYKYSVGLGNVTINDIDYSNGSGDGRKDNNAPNDLYLDCGVGSIEVEIKE